MSQPPIHTHGVQKLGSIILYFASPRRIGLHMFSVAIRALLTPSLQLFLGILVNRLLRLGAARGPADSQRRLLRRFINSFLLSREVLSPVFKILGSHYEDVAVSGVMSLGFGLSGTNQHFTTVLDDISIDGCEGRQADLLAWHPSLL